MPRWWTQTYELSPPGSTTRVRAMEGLRGLAVGMVFLVHYHSLIGHAAPAGSSSLALSAFVGRVGHVGVDLFFVLSGFLIYGALLERAPYLPRFWLRRAQRIYPAFLAVFALYVALSFIYPAMSKLPHGEPGQPALYLLQNLLLLPGLCALKPMITVAWSLSYEAGFYLALPLLMAGLRLRHWPPAARVGLVLAGSAAWLLRNAWYDTGKSRLLMFAAGLLLYEGVHHYQWLRRLPRGASALALAAFVVALLAFDWLTPYANGLPANDLQAPGPAAVLTLAAAYVLFVCVALGDTALHRALAWTPLRYLGNMSYSYYLIHGVTLKGLHLLLAPWLAHTSISAAMVWLLLPPAFVLTWLTATALFVCVEKPLSLTHKVAG